MIKLFIQFIDLLGKEYRFKLAVCFLLSLFAGLMEITGIAMIFPFISMVSNPEIVESNRYFKLVYDYFGFTNVRTMIFASALLVGGLFIAKNLFMIYYQHLQLNLVKNWRNDISVRLMGKYLEAPYLFHLKKSSNHMVNMLGNTVFFVLNSFIFSQMNLFSNMIVALMLMGFILSKFFIATIFSAAIMVFLVVTQGIFIRRQTTAVAHEINKANAHNLGVLSQSLAAIKETKTFVRETYFQETYSVSNKKVSEHNTFSLFVQMLPMYINEIIIVVTVIFMCCIVLVQGDQHFIDVANLAVLAGVAFRLAPMVNRMLYSYAQIRVSSGATRELLTEVTQLDALETEKIDAASPVLSFQKQIALKNINFQFSDDSWALQDVSLNISKGEFVGIVGASGAGKTTLVDIILGLLRQTSGDISIDHTKVTTENLQGLRKLVGYVSQNPFIFTATVKENVAFGVALQDIDEARVIKALEQAQLNDFFSAKEDYLDTPIADNGKSLSGGQRQRLAIARALYANPEILVMDEATSALDVETEHEITQVINALKGEKTIIAIAHRLSTLKECDRVIYMNQGRILDIGTFKELQARHPSFSKIIELSSIH